MQQYLTQAAIAAVAALMVVFLFGGKEVIVQEFGSTTSSTITAAGFTTSGLLTVGGESNLDKLIQGGGSVATTTNGAGTFTAAQVCDNNLILATPNVGNVTLTMPDASSVISDCLPAAGDTMMVVFRNASSTGTAAITLADGSNTVHTEGEGDTTVVDVSEWGFLTLQNIDGTNMLFDVEVKQDAD